MTATVVDLLLLPSFLDRTTCEEIVGELRRSPAPPAAVYGIADGGAVHPNVRSAARVTVPLALRDSMAARFEAVRETIERHFRIPLATCEEPQFLHYRAGDFFVAHQDGNTPLTRDDTRHRRVSVVVFLNDRSTGPSAGGYGGGELLFHGAYPDWAARQSAPAAAGGLIAFRSESTHEVTPVTHGDRFTVVTWFR